MEEEYERRNHQRTMRIYRKSKQIKGRKRAILYTALTRARFFLYCVDYEENVEIKID